MSEIMSCHASPVGRRGRRGGWVVPLLVVVVVALLASGALSSDPEPEQDVLAGMAPASALDSTADAANGSGSVVDDQADFVEFGFDSQFGGVTPRREPVIEMPVLHPDNTARPARQM